MMRAVGCGRGRDFLESQVISVEVPVGDKRGRLVRLGAVRAAIADEFWDGEPARALLAMHSEATLSLLGALFELANELDVGEDETMVAPSLAPDAVVRAPPGAFLAVLRSRFGEAVSSVLGGRDSGSPPQPPSDESADLGVRQPPTCP